jgi:hypothetical protein
VIIRCERGEGKQIEREGEIYRERFVHKSHLDKAITSILTSKYDRGLEKK